MNTEVALSVEGMSLAEAMGINTGGGGTSSHSTLARVNQIHSALTVTDNDGDEHIKVPVGAYKITMADGEILYSKTLSVRIFSQRHQWQRWDADNKTMHKTLLAPNLNVDLKDTTGGFNLGRPSGYIKDFQSLPEEMKSIIRGVKRVRVMLGVLKLEKPTDDMGNPITDAGHELPFVMDVKNNESMKAKYAIIVPSLGEQVPYGITDSEILKDFIEWIKGTNNWIEGKHDEGSIGNLSDADAAMVGSIVEVREFEG